MSEPFPKKEQELNTPLIPEVTLQEVPLLSGGVAEPAGEPVPGDGDPSPGDENTVKAEETALEEPEIKQSSEDVTNGEIMEEEIPEDDEPEAVGNVDAGVQDEVPEDADSHVPTQDGTTKLGDAEVHLDPSEGEEKVSAGQAVDEIDENLNEEDNNAEGVDDDDNLDEIDEDEIDENALDEYHGTENTYSAEGNVNQQVDVPYTIPEEPAQDPATRRRLLEERMDQAVKKKTQRRGKRTDIDLEAMQDAQIQNLRKQMQNAAYEDATAVSEKLGLAIHKMKLLPQVKDVLVRKSLADLILDNNLLEGVRIWLEPLPDGSLPGYEIQKVMFNALLELPIKTIHLRESGLGKVVLFYQKSKRVEPGLKKIADKLVGNWTRPILNLSDNYRDKYVEQETFDLSKLIRLRRKRADVETDRQRALYEETAKRRKRAALPAARNSVYKIAPKVKIDDRVSVGQRQAIGANLVKDEQYKRLSSKVIGRGKKTTKKGGVSIEGRDLTGI